MPEAAKRRISGAGGGTVMRSSHIIRNYQWLKQEMSGPLCPRKNRAHMAGHCAGVRIDNEYYKRGQTKIACSKV